MWRTGRAAKLAVERHATLEVGRAARLETGWLGSGVRGSGFFGGCPCSPPCQCNVGRGYLERSYLVPFSLLGSRILKSISFHLIEVTYSNIVTWIPLITAIRAKFNFRGCMNHEFQTYRMFFYGISFEEVVPFPVSG